MIPLRGLTQQLLSTMEKSHLCFKSNPQLECFYFLRFSRKRAKERGVSWLSFWVKKLFAVPDCLDYLFNFGSEQREWRPALLQNQRGSHSSQYKLLAWHLTSLKSLRGCYWPTSVNSEMPFLEATPVCSSLKGWTQRNRLLPTSVRYLDKPIGLWWLWFFPGRMIKIW